MSRRRPSTGKRPHVRPEVTMIKQKPSPPGSPRKIGKGRQRMIFGNRIIQIEGISIMKFNLREKKHEED